VIDAVRRWLWNFNNMVRSERIYGSRG